MQSSNVYRHQDPTAGMEIMPKESTTLPQLAAARWPYKTTCRAIAARESAQVNLNTRQRYWSFTTSASPQPTANAGHNIMSLTPSPYGDNSGDIQLLASTALRLFTPQTWAQSLSFGMMLSSKPHVVAPYLIKDESIQTADEAPPCKSASINHLSINLSHIGDNCSDTTSCKEDCD
jgi:hypothetical protein